MPGGWGRSHSTGRSCESLSFRTTYDNMISPLLRQAHDWIELFGLLLFRRFLAHGLSITSHSPRGPSRSPQKPGTLQGPFRPFEPPWLPETSSRDKSFDKSFSSFSLKLPWLYVQEIPGRCGSDMITRPSPLAQRALPTAGAATGFAGERGA